MSLANCAVFLDLQNYFSTEKNFHRDKHQFMSWLVEWDWPTFQIVFHILYIYIITATLIIHVKIEHEFMFNKNVSFNLRRIKIYYFDDIWSHVAPILFNCFCGCKRRISPMSSHLNISKQAWKWRICYWAKRILFSYRKM